jgi:hypothetical protein
MKVESSATRIRDGAVVWAAECTARREPVVRRLGGGAGGRALVRGVRAGVGLGARRRRADDALGVEEDDEAVADLGDAVDGPAPGRRRVVELVAADGDDLFDVVDDHARHVLGGLDDDDLRLAGRGVVQAQAGGEVVDRDDLAPQRDHAADAGVRRRHRARLGVADDLVDLGDGQRVLLVAEGEDHELTREGLFGHGNSGLKNSCPGDRPGPVRS